VTTSPPSPPTTPTAAAATPAIQAVAPHCGMVLADFGADVVRVDRPGREPHYGTSALGRGKRRVQLDLKQPADNARLRQLAARADVLIEPYRPGVMESLGLGPRTLLHPAALRRGGGDGGGGGSGEEEEQQQEGEVKGGQPLVREGGEGGGGAREGEGPGGAICGVAAGRSKRLVYARLTGWGQHGRLALRAGHDINYIAQAGTLHQLVDGPGRRPVPPMNLLGQSVDRSISQ
jgi:hypothetical protein